jgi:L-ribulose-5-phosphate 3-epimerase
MSSHFLNRLAVCSWSLQPKSPEELLEQVLQTGLRTVQIALDPIRENPDVWGRTKELCQEKGVILVSGMFGTVGEENIQANVELAKKLGIRLVTFHAGFLPHDRTDAAYKKLKSRIGQIADLFARKGLELAFETGQEEADTLELFLIELNRPNVGVNFDPANMILYDQGDPIDALYTLGQRLKQCHIKDARHTKTPGTWGEEVVAGTGDVDWKGFFAALDELKFPGFCAIEREAGNQRVADIKAAREFVATL